MSADVEQATEYLDALGEPISLSVALCKDYSALLRGEHSEPLSHKDLLIRPLKQPRRMAPLGQIWLCVRALHEFFQAGLHRGARVKTNATTTAARSSPATTTKTISSRRSRLSPKRRFASKT